MADITNLERFLKDVAGAIKTKKGTTALIPAAKFDEEIASITAGGSVELGEYSATFISDKPFGDGSNVKVLYTNDENKLDAIPEPAPFSGRFDGYSDITTSSWGSWVNITTDTIFTTNKVYRANNTLGYIYTYIINEEDRDKCSFLETNDYEMTSDLLLSGVEIAPPEIVVNEGYIYTGWMYNNNVAVIPIWVRGSATINPIILEETDDILQVTFIPDRDRGGFQYNWGSAIYSNESVYTHGLAGMFGVKDTTNPDNSLAGWESITLTFRKSEFEMSGATTLEVLTGDSSAYGFGSINIYDAETDTEVDFLDAMVAFNLANLSHGKTYKISGSIGM